VEFHERFGARLELNRNRHELRLVHGSRSICLPCREDTIRGYSSIRLLVIDEAARVPDDLYKAVSPMLAVSGGRLICLSTPYGKRGFFWDAWANGGDDWARIEVAADRIPRISAEFLEKEKRCLGESWFRQEYFCSFEALEGLVYPEFWRCVVPGSAPKAGTRVGGIDWGFRNPFAAVWGTLNHDGNLWLNGEHYKAGQPLSYHMACLPRDVMWYCDPSAPGDRNELLAAGFKVRQGKNHVRSGIAAVAARLAEGSLRVIKDTCPHLLWEATLYRYDTEPSARKSEEPERDDNHALDALRYLVGTMDVGLLGRRRAAAPKPPTPPQQGSNGWGPHKGWLSVRNEALWRRIF
jgi:hypothetical protein